jgi:hypothetical protein
MTAHLLLDREIRGFDSHKRHVIVSLVRVPHYHHG